MLLFTDARKVTFNILFLKFFSLIAGSRVDVAMTFLRDEEYGSLVDQYQDEMMLRSLRLMPFWLNPLKHAT